MSTERNPFTGEEVNESTALAVQSNVTLDGFKNPELTMYCTLKAETKEEKIKLYNVVNSPSHITRECVNMPIKLQHVYAEVVTLEDGTQVPRVIMIDENGESYQSASFGVYNSLVKIFSIVGQPPFEKPLTVIPKLKACKKGQVVTLELK